MFEWLIVRRDRSRRAIADRLQALLRDAGLDQVGQHGSGASDGKLLISVSAALRAGVACDLDQQSRTASRSTSNAVEHRNAGTVEFGAADAEQDRTGLGHVRQPVLTGAGQCHGSHVYGRHDLKRW